MGRDGGRKCQRCAAVVLVLLVVLVVLVLVGVRHLGDVRRASVTYAATAAGLVLLVVVAAQHLHGRVAKVPEVPRRVRSAA